jgi:hypothetical protein
MDVLERDDLEQARRTSPEERGRQLLEVMRMGFRLKLAALRTRDPSAAEHEIDARFRSWLEGNDGT